MHINTNFGFNESNFDLISDSSHKIFENEDEKNWFCKAIEDIKNPERVINLQKRVSRQIDNLNSFSTDQISRLVSVLDQCIKLEPNSQEVRNYLHQEVAALIIKKDISHFENFFQQSKEKNYAIQSIIQLVTQQKLKSLEAIDKLKRYGIDVHTPEGQRVRIEIAKLAAQRLGKGTYLYINDYGIDASTPGGQKALIEIAKLVAQGDGKGPSFNIIAYGIDASTPEGQQALIEIAKLEAQKEGGKTSEYITNYGIDASTLEGQQALIEIAKLAAEQDGLQTFLFRKNYGIDVLTPAGLEALIEIFKLAVKENASLTLFSLKFKGMDEITDEEKLRNDLSNFLFSCLVKQLETFSYSFIDFKDDFSSSFVEFNKNCRDIYLFDRARFDLALAKLKAHDMDGAVKNCLDLCATVFDMKPEDLQWVKDNLSKIDNEEKQREFLEWWICLAFLCASREDLKRLFREKRSVFERLSTLSPDLRNTLTKEVIASSDADFRYLDKLKAVIFDESPLMKKITVLLQDIRLAVTSLFEKNTLAKEDTTSTQETNSRYLANLNAEIYNDSSLIKKITVLPRDLRIEVTSLFIRGLQDQYAEAWKNMKKATEDIAHVRLAGLILSQYPEGDYTSVLRAIKSDRNLRNAKYQQPMLEALLAIKNSSLGEAAKVALLHKVFDMPVNKRQKSFRLLADIFNCKGEAYLSEVSDLPRLKLAVEKLFVDQCKVKLENFPDLYEKTVGTWRNKEALLTYAGKQTGDSAVLPYFQEFLTAVLQGHFQVLRYAVDKNPHLAEIQQNYPKIFEQWKLASSLEGPELGITKTSKVIPVEKRVIDALKQSVENDHLGLEQQKALFPLLASCKGKWEQLEKPLELIAEKLAPLSNRRLTPEEIELKQRLLLEKNLLELIKNPSDLEKKLNNLKGIKIKGLDEALSPFYQDLEDAVKFMHSSSQPKSEAYTVIDTDDPNHFLLMGTEVLNSCQDVKRSASLNVGLLGYALDGKHRLALVCDPEGKILARSVLRLLIDTEGKPVLFQERIYIANANPAYPQLLRKMALKKAELLGVPLVVSPADFEKEQAKPYPLSIQAKDKPVPYEYVDALAGLKSGPYTIDKALLIHSK